MTSVIVNGETIPPSEIGRQAAQLRVSAGGRSLSLEERIALKEEAIRLLVEQALLMQEARRLHLSASEMEVDTALSQWAKRSDGVAGCRAGSDTPDSRQAMTQRILIDKLLAHWRAAVPKPRQNEGKNYYRVNQQQFHSPQMANASHIACHFEGNGPEKARARIEVLYRRVSAGEEFGDVAAQHSDCPENKGDLGWFPVGLMVKEFDDVIFSVPLNRLTPVFRTEFGFHFALVHARKAAGIRPFSEVRQLIEDSLWLARQDEYVGRAVSALRGNAIIAQRS